MILVDTSIWIDHIRTSDVDLGRYLADGQVAIHPFVIGEVALGRFRDRSQILEQLLDLPAAPVAFDPEVLMSIERHDLAGSGIGYVDAHLLMSARLGGGLKLCTRDRRLHALAERLGVAHEPSNG